MFSKSIVPILGVNYIWSMTPLFFSKIRSIFLNEETHLLISNDVNERKLKETSF